MHKRAYTLYLLKNHDRSPLKNSAPSYPWDSCVLSAARGIRALLSSSLPQNNLPAPFQLLVQLL